MYRVADIAVDHQLIEILDQGQGHKFHPDFDKANETDQIIKIAHKSKTLTLRIVNVILPTGEIENLVTNIMDPDFTNDDFKLFV